MGASPSLGLVPRTGHSPQGAALASMAGLMTYGRRQFEHLDATVRRLVPPFHTALTELTAMVDADARAFEAYLVSVQTGLRHQPRRGSPEGEWGRWTVYGVQTREKWVRVTGRGRGCHEHSCL